MNELTLLKIAVVALTALFAWGLVELRRAARFARWVNRFEHTITWNPLSSKYGPPLRDDEARAIHQARWDGD